MKLYLASHGLPSDKAALERIHDMVGSDKRVLYVYNAMDELSEDERASGVEEKREKFTAAGFDFYELDLRNYFRSPDKLKPLIDAAPFIWVSGGNTFVLRRAFAYSGLDSLLINALRHTNIVYGGSSAGSIIMTNTLHGCETSDDPYAIPEGYKSNIMWDGLGLIYPQLVPHYQSDWFKKEADAMVDYFELNGMHYEILKDGEAYIVDGEYEGKLS